ncbi:methionyl-tRNA formyltransferase [Patescibacteria group bacterium]|nr:methionyl-tRNA formyltransferase [Patescibacteria group bacterium]
MAAQTTKNNVKIVFFGTSDFAVVQLEALAKHFNVIAVVTTQDMPVGRKQILASPPVKMFAGKNKIPVFQPEKLDSNFKIQVSELKPDLFIVAAYGKMIPNEILGIPRLGALNVHPSLLPQWRGPAPIQYAILNGDDKTGVTVMLVDEQMDHGSILSQATYHISNNKITYSELHDELAKLGAKLLVKTLSKWIDGKIKPISQDESKATYSKLLRKEDGRIDWHETAEKINRKIRALNPWPGAFAVWKRKQNMLRLYIERAEIFDEKSPDSARTGEVFLKNNALCVKTGNGILQLLQLQLEGKKSLDAKTFLNGYANIIGSVLQ